MSKDEIKRNSNETPLSEVIDKLLRAYRLDGKMKELDVIEAWPEMMGIAVANRTKEISIRNKILYLTMDSSVMRDELSYGKQIIIQRINEKAGFEMITDVWFG
jgi:predicted nucleic acid-binding Zn ribbon protein